MNARQVEDVELDLLLEAIHRRWGYDFRHYARASLRRRLRELRDLERQHHFSDLIPLVVHDRDVFERLLRQMSVPVTSMFRDPHVYATLRDKIVPLLKTYPFIKIWHAGCATGEEVYSMAIVLHEEGYLQRAQIYATDYNNELLEAAREGIYSLERLRDYSQLYNKAGGKASFADYFRARYDNGVLATFLRDHVTFANHNLVSDGTFGEMNLILCRNVLIYFDRDLQDRVLRLFHSSLCHRGFLCVGAKESLAGSSVAPLFDVVSEREKIYRRSAEVETA